MAEELKPGRMAAIWRMRDDGVVEAKPHDATAPIPAGWTLIGDSGPPCNTRSPAWRSDMENAPRDGTRILLANETLVPNIGYWVDDPDGPNKPGYWTNYRSIMWAHLPLPQPPEEV